MGGTEMATHNIAKRLSKNNEVHIITSLEDKLENNWKGPYFVHRISWPKIKGLGILIFWLKIFICTYKINPDIIHAQGLSMGIPAYIFKKFFNIPYIMWGRGSDVYLNHKNIEKLLLKKVINNSCSVIALTNYMRKILIKTYGYENIHVIHNGIEINRLNNKKYSNKEINILFVGSLRKVKGVEFLIKAMEIAVKNKNDLRLIIVGDGVERNYLNSLTKNLGLCNNIEFTGQISNKSVYNYMNNSDIFVLPSLSEGFPNVLLEAMAFGLPIVTTNFKGSEEIITNDKNGFIVESKNPKQIANRILLLAENKDIRNKMSRYNRKTAEKYNWDNIIKNICKIYLKCLK